MGFAWVFYPFLRRFKRKIGDGDKKSGMHPVTSLIPTFYQVAYKNDMELIWHIFLFKQVEF
jgi:hypothetical protein